MIDDFANPTQRIARALWNRQPSTADTRDILHDIPVRKGGVLPLTQYGDNSVRWDWNAGIPGSIKDAVTAPARAWRGEIPEDQMIPEGLNFAGSVALGSAAVPRPRASVGMGGKPTEAASHLDMSPEARMARAREMGFDTGKVWYHGSDAEFDAFMLGQKGKSSAIGRPGLSNKQIFLTDDRAHAAVFGEPKEYYIRGNYSRDDISPMLEEWARDAEGHKSAQDMIDSYGDIYSAANLDDHFLDQANKARNSGQDGAITSLGGLVDPTYGFSGSIAQVFDPKNIRSVNAAFDPAKSSSANLLAANPETSAAPGLGLMAAAKQEPKGFIAYHGSPHDFDHFDISKIGTGEGAQAYGHGLYFADSEGVAKTYRDNISADLGWKSQDIRDAEPALAQRLVSMGHNPEVAAQAAQTARLEHVMNTPESNLQRLYGARGTEFNNALSDAWKLKNDVFGGPNGRMYQVRINADHDHFLDWDKPLNQQSESVRKALEPIVRREAETEADRRTRQMRFADIKLAKMNGVDPPAPREPASAASIYDRMTPDMFAKGNEAELRDAGIPGIKYLDQGSRAAGEGSRNYVVFDDKMIEILRKYGLLGMLGAGAAVSQSDYANAKGLTVSPN